MPARSSRITWPALASEQLLDDAVYVYDRDRLRTYSTCAEDLQRVALDPERSLALIRSKIV